MRRLSAIRTMPGPWVLVGKSVDEAQLSDAAIDYVLLRLFDRVGERVTFPYNAVNDHMHWWCPPVESVEKPQHP